LQALAQPSEASFQVRMNPRISHVLWAPTKVKLSA
jgi:hypothetical protein